MAAGLLAAFLLLPEGTPALVDLFIGACLCATSIGLSAEVLRQFGAAKSREGRVIVGAAVVDDVLGLLVLGGVAGAVAAADGGAMAWGRLGGSLALALGFLGAALTLGRLATPHVFRLATRFRSHQVLLPAALGFAFLLAWLGTLAGLAAIVGAYAAGLILEPAHVQTLEQREPQHLEQLMQPLVAAFSPLFFVLMGARIDPAALVRPRVLLFTLVLGVLGVAGKLAAGFVAGSGCRWAVVGWGMVPRGEVGLIFADVGRTAGLLSASTFNAVLIMVMATTFLGPLLLKLVIPRPAEPG
jgi:Kef-type K+ transport system membrane component KefB